MDNSLILKTWKRLKTGHEIFDSENRVHHAHHVFQHSPPTLSYPYLLNPPSDKTRIPSFSPKNVVVFDVLDTRGRGARVLNRRIYKIGLNYYS